MSVFGYDRVVLVLEDTESRVEWLRKQVEPFGFQVVHHTLVRTFVEATRILGEAIFAIVLDHDLGGYSMPLSLQDVEGLDGMDACEQLTKLDTKFLVWSSNHEEAPRMEATLVRRGATQVARFSWGDGRDGVKRVVGSWVDETR